MATEEEVAAVVAMGEVSAVARKEVASRELEIKKSKFRSVKKVSHKSHTRC